jgi:poly-gamma-glutamate synthesis protein (capsule biosynthesis protein)
MKKKVVLLFALLPFVITSCGREEVVLEPVQTTEFSRYIHDEQEEDISSEEEEEPVYTQKAIIEQASETKESEEETVEPKEETYNVSLVATGDNLIHSPIYKKASNGEGTYDFTKMYEHVKDFISDYDIAVVNQETIFVEDDENISSYPCFGTPIEMGDALIDAGFDVVLSATNHTWDKRTTGVEDTLNYWKQHPEIKVLGINETEEDYNTVDIISKNNINIAMFNYTYGLNGFTLPEDQWYKVNLLNSKEKFLSDVKSVEDNVDFTICFLHIGEEYRYTPTDFQVDYVNDLIDAGADIVICSHPHVIEPYGEVTTENGNTGLVYYSCGNFISGQQEADRCLGGLASIELQKTVKGDEVLLDEVTSYDFVPVVTHYNSTEHAVYLLDDYTEELASTHSLRSKGLSVDKLWSLWNSILGKETE